GGIPVSAAFVTDRGFKYDRRWMLVDENNIFLTQRELAALALFGVAIEEAGLLVTHQPDGEAILIPFEPQTDEILTVQVWDDVCIVQTVSEAANKWFSSILGMQ